MPQITKVIWSIPTQSLPSAETQAGLHLYCPIFLAFLTKTGTYQQILVQLSNIKFHKNLFSGSRVVMCEQRGYTRMKPNFKRATGPRQDVFINYLHVTAHLKLKLSRQMLVVLTPI
jgi:hypothetical protein